MYGRVDGMEIGFDQTVRQEEDREDDRVEDRPAGDQGQGQDRHGHHRVRRRRITYKVVLMNNTTDVHKCALQPIAALVVGALVGLSSFLYACKKGLIRENKYPQESSDRDHRRNGRWTVRGPFVCPAIHRTLQQAADMLSDLGRLTITVKASVADL